MYIKYTCVYIRAYMYVRIDCFFSSPVDTTPDRRHQGRVSIGKQRPSRPYVHSIPFREADQFQETN